MNLATVFPTHTVSTAPREARPFLERQERDFGFVPLPTARHATAPAVVEGFTALLDVFEHTSLQPMEREAVALALAGRFDCNVCKMIHGGIARKLGAPADRVAALVAGDTVDDPRLDALVRFVDEVQQTHGKVSEEALERFLGAGFTPRHALEVIVGIATYTLSIFANRLTRSETLR